MSTQVDTSSIFDTVLPNAYIRKVTLTPSTPPGSRSGVSYNLGAVDTLQTNRFGKKRVRDSDFEMQDTPDGPKGLRIDIELFLKDRYSPTGKTAWFERKDSLKNINLRVVLSRNETLTRDLLQGNFSPDYLKKARKQNKFLETTLNLQDLMNLSLSEQIEAMIDGQQTYDVSYTASFFIEQMNPKHLSVFATTYSNASDFLNQRNLTVNSNFALQGTTSAQSIISKGQTVNNTFVYLLPNGKVWAGPVHIRDNQIMAGAFHTKNSHPILTKKTVSNYRIEDNRILEEISNVHLLLGPSLSKMPKREKTKTTEELKTIKQESFVSEPLYSSDINNRLKFLFYVNYEKILRERTQYGAILENADPKAKKEILQRSKIKNISIFRNRVQRGLTRDGVREVELEDRTELVANSSEAIAGNLKRTTTTRKILTYDQKSREIAIGAIKEINLSATSGTGVRSFGVTDYEMEFKTDGLYRYTLEMEIEDGTITFLKNQLKKLNIAKNMFIQYCNEAKKRGNFISSSGAFNKTFKDLKRQQYSIPTEQQIEDNVLIRNTAVNQSIVYSPWLNMVSVYLDVLYNISNLNLLQAKRFSNFLINLCQPSTGSLTGLETFLSKIEELETKIKTSVPLVNTSPEETDFSTKTTAFIGRGINNSFRLVRAFKSVHDSNIQKNVGYDFLSNSKTKSIGPRFLTTEQFRARMDSENDKYFSISYEAGSSPQTREADETSQEYSRDLDLQEQFYSYITPAVVSLGEKNKLKTINRGSGLWSEAQYSEMTLNILSVSQVTNLPTKKLTAKTDPLEPTQKLKPPIRFSLPNTKKTLNLPEKTLTNNLGSNTTLGMLNISILPVSQYRKKILIKDLQDGIEEDLNNLLDPKKVLGDDTKFATEPLPVEDFTIPETTKLDIEEEIDLVKISHTLISPLLRSSSDLFSKTKEVEKLQLESFSSTSKMNVIDAIHENLEDGINKKNRFLSSLPNQLKSIVLSSSPVVRKNWTTLKEQTGKDLIKSNELYPLYYFLYNHINKIEVFIGFQQDDQGLSMINRPIFRKMTKEIFEEIQKMGLISVCRLVSYSNSNLSINKSPKLSLPEFDTTFLIGPELSTPDTNQEETVSNISLAQSANEFSESEIRRDTYESRITQNLPLNSTGLEIIKNAILNIRRQDDIPCEFSNTLTILQPRRATRVGTDFSTFSEAQTPRNSTVEQNQNRLSRERQSSQQQLRTNIMQNTRRGGGRNNGGSY